MENSELVRLIKVNYMYKIFLILILTFPVFAQRGDFYDTYDYNMKNQKGGDTAALQAKRLICGCMLTARLFTTIRSFVVKVM